MLMFGVAGVFVGGYFGFKIAEEEEEKKRNKERIICNMQNLTCSYCKQPFAYSDIDHPYQNFCHRCVDSKLRRLKKAEAIAETLMKYEGVQLDFITKQPSEILKGI